MSNEIAFEMAPSSVRFGVGVTREVGMDLADLGVRRVLVLTDAAVSRLPPVQTVLQSLEENRVACDVYDRVRIEPNDVSFQDAIAFAGRVHLRCIRRRRGRLDDRHRQGGQPLHGVSTGRLSGLREPADWKGAGGPWTAQAADGDSDDGRHRQRNHRRQRVRCDASPRQDRNFQPPVEADARLPRSGQHANPAGGGRRIERAGHPQPRGRVVHGAALHRAAAAGSAVAAASLPGLESDQRHLVARSAPHRVPLSRARGRRSVRR